MCIISLVHGVHANAPDSELQHNLPLIAQSLVFIMELSNGRAAEGGESTLWGRSGGRGTQRNKREEMEGSGCGSRSATPTSGLQTNTIISFSCSHSCPSGQMSRKLQEDCLC